MGNVRNFKKISDDLSAVGQPTPEQLQEIASEGFKSVVNLRSPEEPGVVRDEEQHATDAGLDYLNIPLNPTTASNGVVAEVISQIEGLPQPILFHCGVGGRASTFALIALATQQKLNRDQVLLKAKELGINPDQPHLKQFLDNLS